MNCHKYPATTYKLQQFIIVCDRCFCRSPFSRLSPLRRGLSLTRLTFHRITDCTKPQTHSRREAPIPSWRGPEAETPESPHIFKDLTERLPKTVQDVLDNVQLEPKSVAEESRTDALRIAFDYSKGILEAVEAEGTLWRLGRTRCTDVNLVWSGVALALGNSNCISSPGMFECRPSLSTFQSFIQCIWLQQLPCFPIQTALFASLQLSQRSPKAKQRNGWKGLAPCSQDEVPTQ